MRSRWKSRWMEDPDGSQDGGKIPMEVKMDGNQMENLLQKLSGLRDHPRLVDRQDDKYGSMTQF